MKKFKDTVKEKELEKIFCSIGDRQDKPKLPQPIPSFNKFITPKRMVNENWFEKGKPLSHDEIDMHGKKVNNNVFYNNNVLGKENKSHDVSSYENMQDTYEENLQAKLHHHYHPDIFDKKGEKHMQLHRITPAKYFRNISDHTEAIHNYTASSATLNRGLLYHGYDHKTPSVQRLDAALEHYSKPTPEEFHVYTGVGGDFDVHEIRKRSDKVHMPAYTSTSISPSRAASFAGMGNKKNFPEMIRIHIPKGSTHGTYLGEVSHFETEREFLLKRGHTLKFHGEPRMVFNTMNERNYLIHDATIHESGSDDHEKV